MDQNERLSGISTLWSVLRRAHSGSAREASAAQQLLIERYGGAVRRYLLAALRDPEAADELTQEFSLCLVRGDFHRADPERGRFRNYVKTVLFHLISKHRQRQSLLPRPLAPDSPELAALGAPPLDPERQFRDLWRDELLARTWRALADVQPAYHAVLRFRAEHPDMPSGQMVEHLGRQLGQSLSAAGIRQLLHRARAKFTELLEDEVAHSLEPAGAEQVAEELAELDLLQYCRPAEKQ